MGDGLAVSGDVVAEMIDDANANAAKAKASFEEIAARHNLPHQNLTHMVAARDCGPSFGWREATGDAPKLVAERAIGDQVAIELVIGNTGHIGRRRLESEPDILH